MDSNLKQQNSEIEQFLCDVREHFKASLETSEYENTSNLFHVTEAEATARLLHRCELLLQQYANNKKPQQDIQQSNNIKDTPPLVNGVNVSEKLNGLPSHTPHESPDEVSYLDMTANIPDKSTSHEHMDMNASTDSDKTFRSSTRLADVCDGNLHLERRTTEQNTDNDSFDEETQIYDICQVSQVDIDTSQKFCLTSHEADLNSNDCPYMNLPAGHLSIQNSTKYGQLQRIEKRLFFDQSKKCYCGILNDWLLCYADGPTASRPSLTLHLRSPGIEIEHSGDGKRREICFQITTGDPNKKFVFQANNEVDAKEWIHAIEAAIRNDKLPRKLPTPPLMKKITFVNNASRCNGCNGSAIVNQNEYIYEEPSPIYDAHTANELLIVKPPDLPDKYNSPVAMAKKYEYDIPKCPAQPVDSPSQETMKNSVATETLNLLNVSNEENISTVSFCNGQSSKNTDDDEKTEKADFQSKVRDVHSKLSSQLLTVASSSDRLLKKTARKTYSNSSNESETISLTTSPTAKDQKKQKKSNTPNASPQKNISNNNNNCNSTNNNNSPGEKSTKNWFLNRLNKTTSSVRGSGMAPTPTKCRQSEKENLLNSLDITENVDCSSNPSSPILKSSNTSGTNCNKSKVNMIINQFEASGGHLAMFSMEAMANFSAVFSDKNDCNNYEPIMTLSSPPSSLLKKV